MLSFLLPLVVRCAHLAALATAAPPATDGARGAEPPRLELAVVADDARRLAAEVLVDADAVVDVLALDGGVVIDLDLAGERYELRLDTDRRGHVRGAALWSIGAPSGVDAWDTDAALAALMEAGALDGVRVERGEVTLVVDGASFVIAPLPAPEALDVG